MHRFHALLLCLSCLAVEPVTATGEPDTSFGTGGLVLVPFDIGDTPYDQGRDLVIQDDGRIVVGGVAQKGTSGNENRDFAAVRLNADGSLDSSFGTSGRQTVAFDLGGRDDSFSAMAAYPGDRFLLVGEANDVDSLLGVGAWAIARLTTDGTLDTSFDLDGRRTLSLAPSTPTSGAALEDVAVQEDGKILLAGYVADDTTDINVTVARLNADGSLDTGFADNGIAEIDPVAADPMFSLTASIAVRSDGRILVGGATNTDTAPGDLAIDMFVLQLQSDGSIDTDFGVNGTRSIAFDQGGDDSDVLLDLVVDDMGRIIVAGAATTASSGTDMAVARLLSDGSLDASFASGGRALVGFDIGGDLEDRANAVIVDHEDRIYVAGRAEASGSDDMAILRLTAGGLPDPDYGAAGKVVFAIDNDPPAFDNDVAGGIALDDRGRVVVAGYAYLGPETLNYDMAILRLTGAQLFSDRFEADP